MPEATRPAVQLAILAIQIAGVAVIVAVVGLVIGTIIWEVLIARTPLDVALVRQRFGRGLVLALELLAAAGILKTVLAVSVQDVSIVASIIVLRTILSLSIGYELKDLAGARSEPRRGPAES